MGFESETYGKATMAKPELKNCNEIPQDRTDLEKDQGIYRNLSQFIAICRNLFSMYILNALIRDFTSLFDLFNSDSLISQKSVITGLKKEKKEKQSEK